MPGATARENDLQLDNGPLIVYVLLGGNPAPTFLPFSNLAKQYLPDSTLVLITDNPDRWSDFKGFIIPYEITDRHWVIKNLVKRFPEREQIAGGYWIYAVERLFALRKLVDYFPIDSTLLHFESDVYACINNQILQEIRIRSLCTAVPRYSPTEGIASFLFSPSLQQLSDDLEELAQVLFSSKAWIGDMRLLGIGLDKGIIQELPSHPDSAWTVMETVKQSSNPLNIIFDGLAIGQYLFGQDPLHANGYRISGHLNPYYLFDLEESQWKISTYADFALPHLSLSHNTADFFICNIHVHSKEIIGLIQENSIRWKRVIDEANQAVGREMSSFVPDIIHSQPISIINRIRLARRNGLLRTVLRLALRICRQARKRISRFIYQDQRD